MKSKKEKSPILPKPKTCVGELCFNPKTERLEFSYDTKTCPKEIIEKMRDKTPMIVKEKE